MLLRIIVQREIFFGISHAFIQPFVRKTFKLIFRKDLKKRAEMPEYVEA